MCGRGAQIWEVSVYEVVGEELKKWHVSGRYDMMDAEQVACFVY